MARAIWNNRVIAESDEAIVVEGNHYFPPDSVKQECLQPSDKTTVCGWKGTANYYHVTAGGQTNEDAAWYYADPKPEAEQLRGRIAFWKGVEVIDIENSTESDAHGEC